MNTKVSPLLSGGITALVTSILAASIVLGAVSLTADVSFDTDNAHDVGSQTARAANIYTNNLFANSVSSTVLKIGDTGTFLDGVYTVTSTVDVNSVNAGDSTSTAITVTGAAVGDSVVVTGVNGDLFSTTSTFVSTSWVSAANTVTLNLFNASATSTMDAGETIIRALVVSPQ